VGIVVLRLIWFLTCFLQAIHRGISGKERSVKHSSEFGTVFSFKCEILLVKQRQYCNISTLNRDVCFLEKGFIDGG
jgi:hypothetical protein